MDSPTLYQRVLGRDFNRLPPVLQRFHSQPQGNSATGMIAVEYGTGTLRHAAARVLRLPYPGDRVPLRLQVIPRNGKELWIRHFDRQCVRTLQWQEGPYLVEKVGALHLILQLTADEQGLTFNLHHSKLFGIRLPANLPIHVGAHARGREDHWHIEVTIAAPGLGRITTYRGDIFPH